MVGSGGCDSHFETLRPIVLSAADATMKIKHQPINTSAYLLTKLAKITTTTSRIKNLPECN